MKALGKIVFPLQTGEMITFCSWQVGELLDCWEILRQCAQGGLKDERTAGGADAHLQPFIFHYQRLLRVLQQAIAASSDKVRGKSH